MKEFTGYAILHDSGEWFNKTVYPSEKEAINSMPVFWSRARKAGFKLIKVSVTPGKLSTTKKD